MTWSGWLGSGTSSSERFRSAPVISATKPNARSMLPCEVGDTTEDLVTAEARTYRRGFFVGNARLLYPLRLYLTLPLEPRGAAASRISLSQRRRRDHRRRPQTDLNQVENRNPWDAED